MIAGMSYMPPRLLPLAAMARRLRVRSDWLRAEAGRVPSLPAGDRFLFDAEAVEKALLKRAAEGEGVADER